MGRGGRAAQANGKSRFIWYLGWILRWPVDYGIIRRAEVMRRTMKEILIFPLELAGFVVAFIALHLLLIHFNVSGLGALLAYSLPVIACIALATGDGNEPKDMAKSFGVITLWFGAVLLACAGIAVSV